MLQTETAMATEGSPGDPAAATCPICQESFKDPVTIDCGHDFCRACLTGRWAEPETDASCPRCGETAQQRNFRPNRQLANLVEPAKKLQEGKKEEGKKGECEGHQEPLKPFCKEDQAPVSLVCDRSKEHWDHKVVPVEEAAQLCKITQVEATETPPASFPSSTNVEEEAMCPICLECLTKPLTLDCRHNFCEGCITDYCRTWEEIGDLTCPVCKAQIQAGSLQPNWQLANIVEKIKLLQLDPAKETVCMKHNKEFSLYCKEDGELLCAVCTKSPEEHRSHTLLHLEEAAQECKIKIQERVHHLRKVLGEVMKLEAQEEAKTAQWKEKVEKCRAVIVLGFKRCHQATDVEKQLLLEKLQEEEQETLEKLQNNEAFLREQRADLQNLVLETECYCQQPPASLLKGVKNTLTRSERVLPQEPQPVSMDLQASYDVPGLTESLRRFRVPVTLDPDSANPYLCLSMDLLSVHVGDQKQDVPKSPARFETCTCLLGRERFTSGQHYWEVCVEEKINWTLGVCRESVSRQGIFIPSPEIGFWAVWLRNGSEYAGLTSPLTVLELRTRPGAIGIFLDYDAGEISFYNADNGSHIFTFADSFSGPLRPYFFPGVRAGGLNDAPLVIRPACQAAE